MCPITPSLLGLLFKSPNLLSHVPDGEYSIIIPLYNKNSTILNTIHSCLNQTRKSAKVIVIDDCSTDGSKDLVKLLGDKITLIENLHNMGKAKSINRAIKVVRTPYVLIVDADTEIEKNFAHQAMRGFYCNEVMGVCGKVLPQNPNLNNYSLSRLVEYLYSQRLYKMLQTKISGIWVLCGCATMWKTSFLKYAKIPLSTVVEDMDVSWKAQSKHFWHKTLKVNYNPNAICYTEEPKSFISYAKQLLRWFSYRDVITKEFSKVKYALRLTALWSLGEGISFPIYSGIALYNLFTQNFLGFLIMILVDLGIVASVTLWEAKKIHMVKEAINGLPIFYILRFFNAIMFFRAMIRPKRKW